jgi:predicted dehydrogenase
MGSVHARAIGPRLAAVYSSNPRKLAGDLSDVRGNLEGAGGTLDFSGVAKYSSIDDLLADSTIDAVDICLPTDMHESVAIQALRAGKHVLVEKPMALDGPSARRMIAEANACDRTLMCGQVLRFLPEYSALREALPRLGRVTHATFHRRCGVPTWGGWLLDPARSGGAVFDLLIHDVDYCLYLFGPPAAVAATGSRDTMDAQLYYPGGFVAVITGGWECATGYPFRMEYRVSGDRGVIEYCSTGRAPTLYTANEEQLPLSGTAGHGAEIEYFIACREAGRPPMMCPPEDSARAVELTRLLLAARDRNGEKIPCNL